MTIGRRLLTRLSSALLRRRLDARLDEEIQTHLAMAVDEGVARGLPPDEASAAALRAFGGVMQTREAHRDLRRLPVVETVARDVRDALRGFRRTPGFTIVALVTLTLAIGANTAIFSLLNALALRDAPVRDPQTLVQIATMAPDDTYEAGLTFAMFRDLQQRQQAFSSLIGWLWNGVFNVESDRGAAQAMVSMVGGNFYSELGVRPVAGRLLTEGDVNVATLQPAMVAVIGYGFWQRHFGGDASVLGRQILVEGTPFTIVGIAPPRFTGLGLTVEGDVTVPLTAYPRFSYSPSAASLDKPTASFWVMTTGRLKPGVSLTQARADLATLWPTLKAANVPADLGAGQKRQFLARRLSVTSAAKGVEPGLRGTFNRPLSIVFGIALLIVTLACVNLASLMLARTSARQQEIGIRIALGASRWRVAQQLLTEGVVIATAGAACGSILAYGCSDAVVRAVFQDYLVPATLDVRPDGRVLAFTWALTLSVGVIFTLLPAWRATHGDTADAMRQGSRTHTSTGGVGRSLVGVQIALSLVLVAVAGLLVRSLQEVRAVRPGMRPEGVVVAYPSPHPGGYRTVDNDSYYPALLARLRGIAGVQSAAVSLSKPAGGGTITARVANAARPPEADAGVLSVFAMVSPGFFDTLQIPLRAGRDFEWRDGAHAAGVVVLSETLARRLFPAGDALGQHVRIGVKPGQQSLEVVGVAADARVYNLKDGNVSAAYVAALQQGDSANWKCFVIRSAGVSIDDVNRVLDGFGHERVHRVETLTHVTDQALLKDRLTAMIAGFFGVLALLIAAVGLYGLISYAVAQRNREIGIRLALGAAPARVMREIMQDGLSIALAGVGAGFTAALAAVQFVKSLLFGITPYDPTISLLAPLALIIVAAIACFVPAMKASRVDPMIALRAE